MKHPDARTVACGKGWDAAQCDGSQEQWSDQGWEMAGGTGHPSATPPLTPVGVRAPTRESEHAQGLTLRAPGTQSGTDRRST